jgi:O-antigen/teichoic acid export membrane protein
MPCFLPWWPGSLPLPLRPVFDRECWRFYLEAGWPLGASIVVNVMIMRADTILLAIMNPAEDVGYYGVGIKITEILTSVAMLFANLVMPLLVQAVDRGDEFRRYVSGSIRVMLIVSMLIVCVLMYFCADIIRLIAGSGYDSAVEPTRVLSLAVMAYFVTSAYRLALTALGEQRAMLTADLWGFAAAIPAYGLLIYLQGLEGAAWARVLANVVIMLAAGRALVHRVGSVFPSEVLWKMLVATALALSIFVGLDRLGCYWMVNIALGSSAYVACLVVGGAIPLDLFLARRSEEPG